MLEFAHLLKRLWRKQLAPSLSTLSDDTVYHVYSIVFIDPLSRGGKISPRVTADRLHLTNADMPDRSPPSV